MKVKDNFIAGDKDGDGEIQVYAVLYPMLCAWFYAVNVMFSGHTGVIV